MPRIFGICLLLLLPFDALALSCMPYVLDQEKIDQAEIVFEGEVTALEKQDKESDSRLMQKETFTVVTPYKGVRAGDTVVLYRDIYWGDGMTIGSRHLVLSSLEDGAGYGLEGMVYLAPSCMHTGYAPLDGASRALLEP